MAIAALVCVVFPKGIVSYFINFTTDLSKDVFELPLFYWFMPFYPQIFNWRYLFA